MTSQTAGADQAATLADTFAPAAFLLTGVPVITVLVMTAVRYVAHGTF